MTNELEQPQYIMTAEVAAADAEDLAEWVRQAWAIEPVQVEHEGGARVWLDVYFTSEVEAELAGTVLRSRACVLAASVHRCEPRDWQTFWRNHFHSHDVGRRLRICPAWETEGEVDHDRTMVIIQPGMSFGTGDHFTTRFCLEMVEDLCGRCSPKAFLDLGTGSGILAIAAARLGVPRVLGVDCDDMALAQAAENVALNGVEDRIELRTLDLAEQGLDERFELVCANLNTQALITAASKVARATERYLAVSGVREVDADAVAAVYTAFQGREVVRDGDGEWSGLLFEFGE